MNYTYHDFFNVFLTKELNQAQENGDPDDSYVFIDFNEGINYVNETIKELFEQNDNPWIREEDFYFNGATAYFKAPSVVHRIHSYYNTADKAWRIPSDASDMYADVRAVSSDKLYFRTEKAKGSSIKLRVSVYPPDVIHDSDTVAFPEQHMRYLRLCIISKALGRRGKSWNETTQREFLLKERAFKLSGKKVKRGVRLSSRGAGFGN